MRYDKQREFLFKKIIAESDDLESLMNELSNSTSSLMYELVKSSLLIAFHLGAIDRIEQQEKELEKGLGFYAGGLRKDGYSGS